MHRTVPRHKDPGIAWDGDHVDTVMYGIYMYNHHHLGKQDRKIVFTIAVTSKQENVPRSSHNSPVIRRWSGNRFLFAPAHRPHELRQRVLYLRVKIQVAIRQAGAP